jgi:imidazolonepropionase-like amidohydrolase
MILRSIALALLFAAPASAAETHVYRAARLWPGDGPAIADAVLVVRDGKVVTIGKRADIKIPDDAVMHDLGDATIIPGLVISETTLADRGKDDLHVLTPHYRAIDAFDPFADYSNILAGGVTTVQLSPGGKRLLPGQGAVVKLFGDDLARRTLREEESLRLVLGDAVKNPPRIYEPPVGAVSVDRPLEPTRPQLGGGLASVMAGLRAAFQAARADRSTSDTFLRSIGEAGTAKRPLRVTTPGLADVQAAVALAKELDLRLILVDPPAMTSEQLASWKAHIDGVILNPGMRPGIITEIAATDDPAPAAAGRNRRRNPAPAPASGNRAAAAKKEEVAAGSPAESARDMRAAGLRVAVKPMQDADLKEILYLGGLFTTHSTSAEALKMLTADAAGLLGVADRVGTLTAGKDADFVVLGGEPFGLHTRVRTVYVDGQVAYDAAAATVRSKVIRGARVLTGSGESVNNGAVLIEGGAIRAVGRDVSTPADVEEKRFVGAVIVPGFLDLGNGLGLGGPLNSTIALNTKLGARLVSGEPAANSARQGGVTTVLLSAQAPSPVLAFKLGDKLRPVKDPVALRFAVRGNLTQAGASLRDTLKAAKTYSDSWLRYEAELPDYERKKREYDANVKELEKKAEEKKDEKKDEKKAEEKKPEEPKAPTKPQANDAMEPYRALFAGKIPALVEAKREDAIRLAIAICRDEFNLRTILIGADDAYRINDLLAEKNVAAIAGPELVRTVDRNEVNLPLSLTMRGVPVGYQSQATSGAKHLPLAVGFAVRHGLGSDEALRGLTSAPAHFLGLDSLGTLAVGKDADLVVLSGMPFEASTRVLAVMIDGAWVYREE